MILPLKQYLKKLFDMDTTAHSGLNKVSKSLLHPICFDAMKFLGDSLQTYQSEWLIENAPKSSLVITKLFPFEGLFFYDLGSRKKISISNIFQGYDFMSLPISLKLSHSKHYCTSENIASKSRNILHLIWKSTKYTREIWFQSRMIRIIIHSLLISRIFRMYLLIISLIQRKSLQNKKKWVDSCYSWLPFGFLPRDKWLDLV